MSLFVNSEVIAALNPHVSVSFIVIWRWGEPFVSTQITDCAFKYTVTDNLLFTTIAFSRIKMNLMSFK